MKEELISINSDAINRYRFVVLVTAMEKSLKDVYNNGMPMLIGHDFHRPIGWTLPFGIFMEAKLSQLIGVKMTVENNEEIGVVSKTVQNFLGKRYYQRFSSFENDFLKLIQESLSTEYERFDAGCVAVIDKGIAVKAFPALFAGVDKNGLTALSDLLLDFEYAGQGIFKHKTIDLTVFVHEYFRRSQSRFNNFHFHFLDALLKLKDADNIQIRIRLDEDMVGYSPSFHYVGELEFIYGPPYSDDISKIKQGIRRHKCNDSQRFYYGVSATEFYWKIDDKEMTFEMEELKDEPSPVDFEKYNCRYVHSIFNATTNEFVHFDGAMRSYDFEAMTDRVSKSFLEYGRKAEYKKLFRLDGKINLSTWKTLVTLYLQANPLIYEYFGIDLEEEIHILKQPSSSAIQKLLPFDFPKEEGIKLLVSYHKISDSLKEGRYIEIFDVMNDGKEKIYCLEHLIFEVKKALQRVGDDIEIPGHIVLTKSEDQFWNIPSIMHNGENASIIFSKTIEAFILLFDKMYQKGLDINISLTLSFTINERIVRISSYGNIKNQIDWLRQNFPLEFSETGITNWVGKQRDYLSKFEVSSNPHLMGALVQYDGVLYVKRIPVMFPYKFEPDETGLKFNIQFPEKGSDKEFNLLNEQKIRIMLHMSIEKAVWADTKEDYFTSKRSKWLDDHDTGVELVECTPLALYWASVKTGTVASQPKED